jgi:hypothetical protein
VSVTDSTFTYRCPECGKTGVLPEPKPGITCLDHDPPVPMDRVVEAA